MRARICTRVSLCLHPSFQCLAKRVRNTRAVFIFFSSLSIFACSGVCIYVFKPHLGFHFLKSMSLCALQLLFQGQARHNHPLPYLRLLSPSPITPGFYYHIVSVTVLPFTHLSHHHHPPPSAVLILSLYLFD